MSTHKVKNSLGGAIVHTSRVWKVAQLSHLWRMPKLANIDFDHNKNDFNYTIQCGVLPLLWIGNNKGGWMQQSIPWNTHIKVFGGNHSIVFMQLILSRVQHLYWLSLALDIYWRVVITKYSTSLQSICLLWWRDHLPSAETYKTVTQQAKSKHFSLYTPNQFDWKMALNIHVKVSFGLLQFC